MLALNILQTVDRYYICGCWRKTWMNCDVFEFQCYSNLYQPTAEWCVVISNLYRISSCVISAFSDLTDVE